MRSQDAGGTWESVLQLGSADFHAISVVGVLWSPPCTGRETPSRDAGERSSRAWRRWRSSTWRRAGAHAPLGGDLRAGQLRLRRGRPGLARTRPDAERPARLGVG